MSERILFQGDSITDCGRKRDDFYDLGNGYANLVKASLGLEFPKEYEFINRGIGGDRIVDLYARIKIDITNLKPDYLSIYIGVNDAWSEVQRANGVSTDKFEIIYRMLIEEITELCPKTKIIIISPFVIEGSGTCNNEEMTDRFDRMKTDVAEKSEVARKIADRYGCHLIELQSVFDEACTKAPPDYWTRDGVHPTICGHEIIKRVWLETFNKINK